MESNKYNCYKCEICNDNKKCIVEDLDFYDKDGKLRVFIALKNNKIDMIMIYDDNRDAVVEKYYND